MGELTCEVEQYDATPGREKLCPGIISSEPLSTTSWTNASTGCKESYVRLARSPQDYHGHHEPADWAKWVEPTSEPSGFGRPHLHFMHQLRLAQKCLQPCDSLTHSAQ
jgi:hypothetical protein